MNILDLILNAQEGGAVRQLANQFGLDEGTAQTAVSALLPALAGAVQRNTQQDGGLDALLGALGGGNHSRYLDDPSMLGQQESVEDGNGILGHLLGSKDVSRQLASQASAQTGLDSGLLKQMLPLVAALLMGGLSQQASSNGLLGAAAGMLGGGAPQAPAQAEGLLGMLTPLLDQNRDGSALDDILGMASKFLTR